MPNPKPTAMMKLADLRDYGVMCFFEYELRREELDGDVDKEFHNREDHVKWRQMVVLSNAKKPADDLVGARATEDDQPGFHTYAPQFQALYSDPAVALKALVDSDTDKLIPKLRRRRRRQARVNA